MDEKKAIKLTEKIFVIYDDVKAKQRSKKRSHSDSKDKDKDAKRAKIKDDGYKNDKNERNDRHDKSERNDRNDKKEKKDVDYSASDQVYTFPFDNYLYIDKIQLKIKFLRDIWPRKSEICSFIQNL